MGIAALQPSYEEAVYPQTASRGATNSMSPFAPEATQLLRSSEMTKPIGDISPE